MSAGSVVSLELGYKVTDRSNRFVRCGVCLAFEFTPLRVSLSRYRFTISVASVRLFFIGRDRCLCAALNIPLPLHLLESLNTHVSTMTD